MAITTITNSMVSVNAIQGTLIADNAITAVHIASNAVASIQIAENNVTAREIASNSITVAQLADDSVESDKIADGVITTNHLNKAMISSQTAVTPVAGDYVLLGDTSDSNNLKKSALTLLLNSNVDLSTKLNLSGGTMTGDLTIAKSSAGADSTFKVASTAASGVNDATVIINNGGTGDAMLRFDYESDTDRARIGVTTSAQALQFFTAGNNEKMRIASSGKITTRGTTSTGNAVLEFGTININNNVADGTVDFAQGLAFTANASAEGAWTHAGICTTGSSGYNGNLVFGTDGTSSRTSNTITERMRISSAGKVGIGTTSPATPLHIQTASISDILRVEDTASNSNPNISIKNDARTYQLQTVGARSDSFEIWDATAGLTRLAIESDGTIQLGNPATGNAVNVCVMPAGKLFLDAGGHTYIQESADNVVDFYTGGGKRLTLSNALAGAEVAGNLSVTDATNLRVTTVKSTGGGTEIAFKVTDASNNMVFQAQGGGGAHFNYGPVGIGTTSPSAKFAVDQAATGTPAVQFYSNSSNTVPLVKIIQDGAGSNSAAPALYIKNDGAGNALTVDDGATDTTRFKIDYLGRAASGTYCNAVPYDGGQFNVTAGATCITAYVGNTGFASKVLMLAVEATNDNSNYHFAEFYSGRRPDNGGGDMEFKFRGDGNAYADASWNASGADYAEYFEWSDGNASSQDRIGLSVVLVNNKIREATGSDAAGTIIGVISGNATVVGDSSFDKWAGKYEKDDYGRYVFDSEGQRKENASYDDSLTYVERENRKEWDTVGLMGKLRMKKGQQTGTNWIKMRDISASVEEWLVR